jgi:hypothetical protein
VSAAPGSVEPTAADNVYSEYTPRRAIQR